MKVWFPLWVKQRVQWFRKSTITATRTIFIFYLKTYWCSHRVIVAIIVTQNLLSWNEDGRRRVWNDAILVFKSSKKSSQNVKKERRFSIRKIFEKRLFLRTFFWHLSNRQGHFLTFLTSGSSWLIKSGGFLILFD